MAKAVFRPNELIPVTEAITLNVPQFTESVTLTETEDSETEYAEEEQYTGPTAEDLRREAEAFRQQWEAEKAEMLRDAQDEASAIAHAAEQSAQDEKQRCADEILAQQTAAQAEVEKLLADARLQAQQIEEESRKTLEDERKEALEQGREAGRLEGYTEGKLEVDRLIERTQVVLERAQDKRGEILTETEEEIINLVLLITRKVVKVIADNQREIIVSNVMEALRKVRDRGTVIIRVNLADLKLATEHTKEFIKTLEGVKTIQVVEDSSVDSGGCIIETDFGEIDARIASQLAELEAKILEISPIKSKIKAARSTTPTK